MTSCILWGAWVRYLNWTDVPASTLLTLLRILVIVAGWYFGISALVTHFLARRAIQQAEKSQTRLDGDFTALLAALLAVFVLILWNQTFSPIRFLALFLALLIDSLIRFLALFLALLIDSPIRFLALLIDVQVETIDEWAKTLDSTLTILALLGTLGYAFASGPAAMRRMIACLIIIVFVLGLTAPMLLRNREISRMNLGMHRAAELSRGMIQHHDVHRKLPSGTRQRP